MKQNPNGILCVPQSQIWAKISSWVDILFKMVSLNGWTYLKINKKAMVSNGLWFLMVSKWYRSVSIHSM